MTQSEDMADSDTQAYEDGHRSYEEGVPLSNNPFPKQSYEAFMWEQGWLSAID